MSFRYDFKLKTPYIENHINMYAVVLCLSSSLTACDCKNSNKKKVWISSYVKVLR
jgi:hypothetical protein